MIKTGIIRRIDDLHRLVIPKELCRKAEINIGDPVEICYNPETNTIILEKYIEQAAPDVHIWDFYGQELEAIQDNIQQAYYIRCDNEAARTTVNEWCSQTEIDAPNWEQNPNGVWKDIGEDEPEWEDLETLKARAMAGYDIVCEELRKFK